MADEKMSNTVVILPGSPDGLRGSARTLAATAEAKVLAGAIAGRLDRIDLFEMDGGFVLLAAGELRPVGGEALRGIIRSNFVTKNLRIGAGGTVEKVFVPVEPSEGAIRQLLTAPVREGGLQGLLPPVIMAAPRQHEPQQPVNLLPETRREVEQGRAVSARHAQGAK
jgi:hypothetical protein